MTKIEIIDCEDFNHKINMMIDDSQADLIDAIYFSIEKNIGISKSQIKKLDLFKKSCKGPIMVHDYSYIDNGAKEIYSRDFDFSSIHVYLGEFYIHIYERVKISGKYDIAYRIPKDKYIDIEQIRENISIMKFQGLKEYDSLSYIWHGQKVY